jgi:hypothetical protein
VNSTTATSTSFGSIINNQGNDPRSMQFTGKINF